ncbi:T9SS type A sorting domain-containing protein [Aequorivita marisscotiae]|uniref:T9SS type A sorting domain-containing protein n=1 Tax=Aequorivita marisscotiae TaxID=3040348 RepID=A0ABY8KZE4_9FLAO|nr:T9SS type A sorting domain-containing protein [Aequorivita sp. Ant34-E75]WGF93440.1 T9SS type A sorting domain-containing protein [Aequorivita sp. Ant34-E75]
MKYLFTFIIFLIPFLILNAQTTYVPDNNFEQVLIDLGLDDVLDDYVLTSNISGVTLLDISNKNILDPTGLEEFSSLTHINIDGNPVGSIPFHPNVNLTDLICQYTQLTDLDLSPHTNLRTLFCAGNNLTSLDLSQNPDLLDLICGQNQLSEIIFNPQINLYEFNCTNNNLTSLDMSQHVSLRYLGCSLNQLTELDLSNNINLLQVRAHTNPPLEMVDIRNDNNNQIKQFLLYNNPNLPYIYVDDCVYSTTNWTDIDPTTIFVEMEGQTECEMIGVEDNIAVSFNLYPNPAKNSINIQATEAPELVQIYSIQGILVKETSELNIDVSNLAPGLYFIKVYSRGNSITKKFMKN